MRIKRCLAAGLVATAVSTSLMIAPSAAADCVDAGGSYVCAQGTVRGGGPTPPTAGPYVPYGCADWYCGDYGLDITIGGGRDGIGPRR